MSALLAARPHLRAVRRFGGRSPGPRTRVARTFFIAAVLLLAVAPPVAAQDGVVGGTVVAAGSLRPLEGVVVSVAGTDLRTRTDARGRFTLPSLMGPEVTLDARRVGYRPLTRTARVGDQEIRLALIETAIQLDALVVTGTAGETEERAIGNAVSRIAAVEVLETAPVGETQQLLGARVPGLTLLPTQGNVGTGGLTVVRGVSSLSLSNEPLVYVDGVRVDNNAGAGPAIRNGRQVARINDLNPEDIAEVQVIKGPAAASLYGTEASRGVIQILTREGVPGPARWAVTVKRGGNWFMNPEDRLPYVYSRNASTGLLDSVHLYRTEVAAGRPLFQTGPLGSYGSSVSGGTDGVRYFVSGQLDQEEGVLSYNWRRRVATRANLSFFPTRHLSVRTNVAYVRNRARFGQPGNDGGTGIIEPLYWGSPAFLDTRTRGFRNVTPEDVATVESRSDIDRIIASLRLTHQPRPWLTQRLTLGTDLGDESSWVLFPRHPDGANGPFTARSLGEKTADRRAVRHTTFDYGVSATAALRPALQSTISFGAQYYAKNVGTSELVCRGFPDPGITDCGGAGETLGSEDRIESKAAGAYGELRVAWNNRLFLTGALRGDDHSAFGERYDVALYPKLQASWIVSEELHALKLRAAWGAAGQQPDAFAAQRSYEPVPGGTLRPLNVGNDSLRPERGQELELGFEAGLWNDRLGLSFTYFRRRTEDAIVARQMPPSLGFPARQLVNLGAVRNSGTELSLDVGLLRGAWIGWDAGLTLATNDSRIESLGGLPPIVLATASPQSHREGYPVGAYFGYVIVSAEVDANGDLVSVLCAGGPENQNRPVSCDSAPQVYAGRPTPSWAGSVRTGFTLGPNVRVHALIDFKGGHRATMGDIGVASNTFRVSRWSQHPTPMYQAWDSLRTTLAGEIVGAGFINAGFAKLREVGVTYTLPDAWARRIGASRAAVTVLGRNLATLWQAQRWSWGIRVLDPEVHPGSSLSELSGRTQGAFLPQNAQVISAVRLTF